MIKAILKKSRPIVIAAHMFNNWKGHLRFVLGDKSESAGATHIGMDLGRSLDYINRVYADYVHYGQLDEAAIAGRRILEIGPGDNMGVLLLFLAAGAEHAIALDKFYSHRDMTQQKRIYQAMRDHLAGEPLARFDDAVQLSDDVVFNPRRLEYIYGTGADGADELFGAERFDMIISRAVVEEIFEPEPALRGLDRALKPGGLMLHKIDLRDYGFFTDPVHHPLTFLTVGDFVHRLMSCHRAVPNRRRVGDYRRLMAEMGYDTKLLVTSVLGVGSIEPHKAEVVRGIDYGEETLRLVAEIRPRLAKRFCDLPDEELAVTGVFMIARKGGGPARPLADGPETS